MLSCFIPLQFCLKTVKYSFAVEEINNIRNNLQFTNSVQKKELFSKLNSNYVRKQYLLQALEKKEESTIVMNFIVNLQLTQNYIPLILIKTASQKK